MFQNIKLWFLKEKSYIDHWFEINERWRYLTVAVVNVILKYLVFAVLVFFYPKHYQVSLLLSWLLSFFSAFVGYKFLVFATEGNHLREYFKSTAILSWSYLLNTFFLWAFVENLLWDPYLSQALILFVLTSFNFLLFKHFAFKQQKIHFWEKIYAVFD